MLPELTVDPIPGVARFEGQRNAPNCSVKPVLLPGCVQP
jgi:hypothetical protein